MVLPVWAAVIGLISKGDAVRNEEGLSLSQSWQVLLMAVGFLTRLPLPKNLEYNEALFQKTPLFFPAVGLLVALLTGLVAVLGFALFDDLAVAVVLSMLASLLITGAFHEDGLADSADGFGGGWQREDVLRIMKDSRIGTFGAAALVCILALKAVSLTALGDINQLLVALCWGHVLSRAVATSLMLELDYVRGEGKSKPLARQIQGGPWLLSLLPLLPVVVLGNWPPLLILALSLLGFRYAAKAYLLRRLGGYTGDALGAVQQLAEVLVYLCFLM